MEHPIKRLLLLTLYCGHLTTYVSQFYEELFVCFLGCKAFGTRYQPNEQLQQVFQEIKQYMENSKKLIILWISGFRIIRGTFTYMHVPSSVCKSWGQSPCWHSSLQSQWLYNVKIIMYFPLTHEWEDPCTL